MRKARGVFGISAVLAIGAGVNFRPRPGYGQEAEQLLSGLPRDQFRHQPLEATQLGDHRFDSLLDDLSREALAARRAR